MTTVSDRYAYVVGVDTHAKHHWFKILDATTAGTIDAGKFPTSPAGLTRAMNWIASRTDGNVTDTLISAEGTGSYGAGLTRLLLAAGYRVVDAPAPKRGRGKSKDDAIDAHKAAFVMLDKDVDGLADARAGELHECLKTLLAARNRMTSDKTRSYNALVAELRGHPLGIDARTKPSVPVVKQIAKWRPRNESLSNQMARAESVRLARQIIDLIAVLKTNEAQLLEVVTAYAPVLLEHPGIGPVNAAMILNAWAFNGRVKSAAAWAALAGAAPVKIESADSLRYRLNRGGDRQLNRALHSIVIVNSSRHPETIAYLERRQSEGKSKRESRRALKTLLARKLYRILSQQEHLARAA